MTFKFLTEKINNYKLTEKRISKLTTLLYKSESERTRQNKSKYKE